MGKLKPIDLWVAAYNNEITMDKDPNTIYNSYRVCHIHFKEEDRNRNNRLKVSAVPSLHLTNLTERHSLEANCYYFNKARVFYLCFYSCIIQFYL